MALGCLIVLIIGSLWTALKERELRLQADQAKDEAKKAGEKAGFEADRANLALARSQQHFEVALREMNLLTYMLTGPRLYQEKFSDEDIQNRIIATMQAIYGNYLHSLPPSSEWTMHEAATVVQYIELSVNLKLNPELYVPWIEKVDAALPRLELDRKHPVRNELLMRHHSATARYFELFGNNRKAADRWQESAKVLLQACNEKPHDLHVRRFYSHNLIYAALQSSFAKDFDKSLELADQSVAAYRLVIERSDNLPEDRANMLDKLFYHARIAIDAKNMAAAAKHQAEFDSLVATFDTSSPQWERVRSISDQYHAALTTSEGQPTQKVDEAASEK